MEVQLGLLWASQNSRACSYLLDTGNTSTKLSDLCETTCECDRDI